MALVWDFDHSMIMENSDVLLIQNIDSSFLEKKSVFPVWTDFMNFCFQSFDTSPECIRNTVAQLRIHEDILRVIKQFHDSDSKQHVLSDANVFFIRELLRFHGVETCFSEIIANPAEFDSRGKLAISRFTSADSPHGCSRCPLNLCKGRELVKLVDLSDTDQIVFYVGDGRGDFCPALALREYDVVFARERFPLASLIRNQEIRAKVVFWDDHEALAKALINSLSNTYSMSDPPREELKF